MEEGWQPTAVTAIVQSRTGYLWLGTYNGLLRFDGFRFAQFDSSNTLGLRNSRITALYEDQEGTLWIGHETGELTSLDATGFRPVGLVQTPPGAAIEAIQADQRGDLWVLNSEGLLLRLRDGHNAHVPGGASASRKASLHSAKDGTLWITANGEAATLKDGRVLPCGFDRENSKSRDYIERVAPSRDGGIWVSSGGRLRKWLDGEWVTDLGEAPCGAGTVSLLRETRSGNLLAGTLRDGLYVIQPTGNYQHFSRTNGLSQDWVRSLCEDHEGNIWIGTGTGLDMLRSRAVEMLSPPDAFQGCAVLSFVMSRDGSTWIGTEGAGIYRFGHQGWTSYGESSGVSNPFVWSVIETQNGELLAGTWGGGLLGKTEGRFGAPDAFKAITAPVLCLYESRNNELWIGTQAGLYRYHSGQLSLVAGKDQLAFPDVRSIAETSDGTIWFAMPGGGLGAWRSGNVRQWRKGDGMPSDSASCLHVECDGTLWIGTLDQGLCRLKDGKFTSVGAAQGLTGNSISQLVGDGQGNLWMGSRNGIFRAAMTELNECADGAIESVRCMSYGKADGLSTLACSSGFQPGACLAADGRLWFPTAKGLAIVDPTRVTENLAPPPVVIEDFLVDGQGDLLSSNINSATQPLQIGPGHRGFEFIFTALSFAAPEKVRFKYRLEGMEREWQDAGGERSVQYNYLPPGDYVFRVIACNNDGVWNNSGASLAFIVLPRFWQTWWFSALAVLGGVGLVMAIDVSINRHRVRRRLEQLERQRAVERERTRIARDIHDDLGASLTRITMLSQSALSDLDSAQPVGEDVNAIYRTARDLTRAMDEIVWAVNPKHDTLDSLVTYLGRFAQAFLSTAGIRCRLEVPVQLPSWTLTAETRHNVFLAFKEALNNVAKHAAAAEVTISLEVLSSGFRLSVQDDGRGFDSERAVIQPERAAETGRLAGGNGLANMRKRLEEVGGRCHWKTAPIQGTCVEFLVPTGGSV